MRLTHVAFFEGVALDRSEPLRAENGDGANQRFNPAHAGGNVLMKKPVVEIRDLLVTHGSASEEPDYQPDDESER